MLQVYLSRFARTVFERFISQPDNQALKDSESYKELFEAVKSQMYSEFMRHKFTLAGLLVLFLKDLSANPTIRH